MRHARAWVAGHRDAATILGGEVAMGGAVVKASGIVAAVKSAFIQADGIEPGDEEILAVLKDREVYREDLADVVAAYLDTKTDPDVPFAPDEWAAFNAALLRTARRYV